MKSKKIIKKEIKTKSVRLSKNIIPIKYDIQLQPDLENFIFEGIETITLFILRKTKSIILHSKELEIETVNIQINKERIFAEKIFYDEKKETATFLFSKNVPIKKNIKLTLVFRGILNEKMRGFYRSKYIFKEKEHYIATTQFESTDARRAFPCFDEPAHKAIFHVSLIVPKGKTTISNTLPVSVAEHSAGLEIIKFSPTPKMSTYLVAFIVGDFEYIEKKSKQGVLVRVYTTPGKIHQAKFALDCAVKTLEFYEKYFDISYPLLTLDMIAIPDFAAAAMENWGAITYRESSILVDDIHTSLSNKQWIALVIAHEIAHQWFGNLVTMEWWTHLWLNESFASYIEYLAIDSIFPKWDVWTLSYNNEFGSSLALKLDALKSTHPIEVTVRHPSEIGEIFDEISYYKGSAVIQMLEGYLGEKDFRNGLRYYLKKHSYKNTETIHLWEAFEKISKKPITDLIKNWIKKGGYPVIHADIVNNKLVLSQDRYFANPISKKNSKDRTIWKIPITLGNNNSRKTILMTKKNITLPFHSPWAKINIDEKGFFRVVYSSSILEKLKEPVEKKILSERDRIGIIRDLFASAESGDISTIEILKFLESYKNEDTYNVWAEISNGLSRLEQILAKESYKEKLNEFILKFFSPLAHKLGWENKKGETHADALLRPLALTKAGNAGDKKIIREAKNKFKIMMGGGHVNPDIRGTVYSILTASGGMKEYNILIKKYKDEILHEEKDRIGKALGNFHDSKILELVCQFALSKHVRAQDAIFILMSVGINPFGRDVWLKCIKKNLQLLTSRYGEGGNTLARLIKAISSSAEEKHLREFTVFFKTHKASGAERAIEQVKEKIEGNIEWLKRDRGDIKKFLK
jgi:puromycin-sensitive aminopeptidase